MKTRIAVIGGTGLEDSFIEGEKTRVGTPFGPSPTLTVASVGSKDIVFLPRHGERHILPPHKINYRANIWALHSMGVERILATNAVGAINPGMMPDDLVVPSDFVDFTRRPATFYDEPPVTHIDVTSIYCPELRRILAKTALQEGAKIHDEGVYLCTEGPRYESPAEIRIFRDWGCDVVGMTGIPEAILAHELGMCYASLCYVTNMAAATGTHIAAEDISSRGKKITETLQRIITRTAEATPRRRSCTCSESLEGARV
jgi:5'-deoxy-5'-methylthioadenosine phosphorylase